MKNTRAYEIKNYTKGGERKTYTEYKKGVEKKQAKAPELPMWMMNFKTTK